MLIQSTKAYGADRAKVLLYGDSGAGKTTLASTLPNTLIISAESGLTSINDKDIDVIDITLDDNRIVIPRIDRDSRLVEVYQYLQTAEAKAKYKNIFLDSLSEVNDNLIEKFQTKYPEKKDSFNLWGDVSKTMGALIRVFRDLPDYNVIMTALSHSDKDENGRFFTGPLVKPKSFAEDFEKYFDYVWYLYVSPIEGDPQARFILTQPTETIKAKSRINASIKLNAIEPATVGLNELLNKISNKGE